MTTLRQPETSIQTISKALCEFIASDILAPGVKLTGQTLLTNIGIDSFSIIEVILFIERRFGVVIPDDQLVPENLKNADALATCTWKHLQQKR